MRAASSSLLLLLSLLQAAVSLPSAGISTELRLSQLETELQSTRSTLLEILKSVSILSKQYVHTDEGVRLQTTEDIDMKIEQLQMKIDENKENVTGVVMAAVEALQKKFDALKEDLSFKLEKKVKRAYGSKFVTEESFEEVSRKVQQLQDLPKNLMQSVNEIKLDLPKTAIMKKEFSSFQLRVARDLAKVKVKLASYKQRKYFLFLSHKYYFSSARASGWCSSGAGSTATQLTTSRGRWRSTSAGSGTRARSSGSAWTSSPPSPGTGAESLSSNWTLSRY